MTEAQAQAAIARYEEAQVARDLLRAEYDAARYAPYATIAAEVTALQAQIEMLQESVLPAVLAIEEQYAERLNGMDIAVSAAEANVRIAVLAVGKSVKGAHLHAVYSKGRDTVDLPGLRGYGKAHPEVMDFITPGTPTVSIRLAK